MLTKFSWKPQGQPSSDCGYIVRVIVAAAFSALPLNIWAQDADYYAETGVKLLLKQEYDEAAEFFESRLKSDERSISDRLGLANARRCQKRYSEAANICDSLLNDHPDSIPVADLLCRLTASSDAETVDPSTVVQAMVKSINCMEKLGLETKSARLEKPNADYISAKSEVDLAFSERPSLSCGGQTELFLREWMIRAFQGDDKICPISFATEKPKLAVGPCHVYAKDYRRARIWLPSEGTQNFDERLLAALCFEVFNVENVRGFLQLRHEAQLGMVCEKEFTIASVKLEHRAIHKTRRFYCEEVAPRFVKDGFDSDPRIWFAICPISFAHYMKKFDDNAVYPWKTYSRTYAQFHAIGYWTGGFEPITADVLSSNTTLPDDDVQEIAPFAAPQ